jgi:pimeloyl-ACP methyl ester carboxylesterase
MKYAVPPVLLVGALCASAIALSPSQQSSEDVIADALQRAADAIERQAPGLTPEPGVYLITDPDDADTPETWATIDAENAPERLVLLVHGLDEPGSIWNRLAPALDENGFVVARFEYPNDQKISASADLLTAELSQLHAIGVEHIDIVAHSMGGLVSRDALTRPGDEPDRPEVGRLIMVGTPQHGSPLAPLRGVAEARERLERWLSTASWDPRPLFDEPAPGAGEAGVDLEPESAFLVELNARPNPEDVEFTVIAGRIGSLTDDEEQAIRRSEPARTLLGKDRTDRLLNSIRDLAEGVGDGVVPLDSALALDVPDTVVLEGSHRGMLLPIQIEQVARGLVRDRQPVPPAIPVILARLDPKPHDPHDPSDEAGPDAPDSDGEPTTAEPAR